MDVRIPTGWLFTFVLYVVILVGLAWEKWCKTTLDVYLTLRVCVSLRWVFIVCVEYGVKNTKNVNLRLSRVRNLLIGT